MQIDSSKPHIGRVYDYVLGGHHNFEVDRQMAAHIMELMPSYPKWARLNRWFLQFVAERWAAEDRQQVLDLASGLPTQGHMHECMPDARILYSDNDPLSVTYGRQILEKATNTKYVLSDLTEPEHLLADATAFFGDSHEVAVGCIGIAYFLSDDQLKNLAQTLHDWCAPGSTMAISFLQSSSDPEDMKRIDAILQRFKQMRINIFFRTPEQLAVCMQPWRITETRLLEDWLGIESQVTSEDPDGNIAKMFGAMADY